MARDGSRPLEELAIGHSSVLLDIAEVSPGDAEAQLEQLARAALSLQRANAPTTGPSTPPQVPRRRSAATRQRRDGTRG